MLMQKIAGMAGDGGARAPLGLSRERNDSIDAFDTDEKQWGKPETWKP